MTNEEIELALDKFTDNVWEICSRGATIILGNGMDLLELDMSQFNRGTYFISDMAIERGKFYLIEDKETKKKLYKFCREHEDRVFIGTKLKEGEE